MLSIGWVPVLGWLRLRETCIDETAFPAQILASAPFGIWLVDKSRVVRLKLKNVRGQWLE